MTIFQLATLAKDLSVVLALIVAIWGGWRKAWVWGHHYQEACDREIWWRGYAMSLQELSENAVRLAERRRRA